MLTYRYRPLKHDDSIRILVLHPSVNSSDPVTCTIQHARLSDTSLEYEALSYTWGGSTRTQTISFSSGRRELLVGENCRDALWRLRLGDRDRVLWIDAICINQENLAERTRQVRIMDVVYRRAFNVVVFLGEQVSCTQNLFDELAAVDEILADDCYVKRPPPSDALSRS
jgi:hypothetical protein